MQVQNDNNKLILSYSPKTRLISLCCISMLPLAYLAYKFVQGRVDNGEVIGIGVGMFILAIAGVGVWTPSRFVFDKNSQLVTWYKKKIGSTNEGHASFADIKEVKRVEYRDAEGSGWKVILVLPSKEVPLVDGWIQSEKRSREIANEINQFLGRG